MMKTTVFDEIYAVLTSNLSLRAKYKRLYDCLDRLCILLVEPLTANYNSLFTRLQALCRIHNHPMTGVDDFRYMARQVTMGLVEPSVTQFLSDTRSLVDAVAKFTDIVPPMSLMKLLPDTQHMSLRRKIQFVRRKKSRFVIVGKDDECLYGIADDISSEEPVKIYCLTNDHTIGTACFVEDGMQVNVVSYFIDGEGIVHPDLIIIEPDYLIDVSRLTSCVKPYGRSPYNYLIDKLKRKENTRHILMGHVANQFLDDCVNNPQADYAHSLEKAFHDHIIPFTVNHDIDRQFFNDCESQFANIRKIVNELRNEGVIDGLEESVLLEPSFFCETLGIQGRFDLLASDFSFLVELKSGKKNFTGGAKEEHMLQMLLYKEILFYNLGISQNKVAGNVLYSKYPEMFEQRTIKSAVQDVLLLRNKIVVLERKLVEGAGKKILSRLTPERLLENRSVSPSLWERYSRPDILNVLKPLQTMDSLTADYFYTFFQFVEREHMLAKVGDNRIQSSRGMASLWNVDVSLKKMNGDIVTDLNCTDIRRDEHGCVEAVRVSVSPLPTTSQQIDEMEVFADESPNFRVGDAAVLYHSDNYGDNVTNHQVIRCTVESISGSCFWLLLRHPQRNMALFEAARTFCLEHDHLDSSFNSQYASLFSLVTAPKERRDLLLCQRMPLTEPGGEVWNSDIDRIVENAVNAKDFFLLVGPPGTGKTSVALRAMVCRFSGMGQRMLLLAYTNRAVDEICCMLENTGLDYLRLGKPLSCEEQYRKRLLSNKLKECKTRQEVRESLNDCKILVSTVSMMDASVDLLSLFKVDVAIFDEASQILEPQILGLLCSADENGSCHIPKFILIGDHKQLPAVVMQSTEKSAVSLPLLNSIGLTNCRNSLFERLHLVVKDDSRLVASLHRQGRMHEDVAAFASSEFYHSVLQPVPLEHQTGILPFVKQPDDDFAFLGERVAFVNVPRSPMEQRTPKSNLQEAEVIARVVVKLDELYQRSGLSFSPVANLGVIVPFRRQISLIRNKLKESGVENVNDIIIDTVERFQGSQRDVIIYDTCISEDYEMQLLSEPVEIDGTLTDRKLNVALTRARNQLFIVGAKDVLCQSPIYEKLIDATPNFNV